MGNVPKKDEIWVHNLSGQEFKIVSVSEEEVRFRGLYRSSARPLRKPLQEFLVHYSKKLKK